MLVVHVVLALCLACVYAACSPVLTHAWALSARFGLQTHGKSALHFAAETNNIAAVRMLLLFGAASLPDRKGMYPIDYARQNNGIGRVHCIPQNSVSIVQLLAGQGAGQGRRHHHHHRHGGDDEDPMTGQFIKLRRKYLAKNGNHALGWVYPVGHCHPPLQPDCQCYVCKHDRSITV